MPGRNIVDGDDNMELLPSFHLLPFRFKGEVSEDGEKYWRRSVEEFNKDDSVNHPMTTIGFHMFFYSWFLLDIGGVWSSDIAHLCYFLGYLMALFGSMTLVVGALVDKAGKVIKEVKNTNAFYN